MHKAQLKGRRLLGIKSIKHMLTASVTVLIDEI